MASGNAIRGRRIGSAPSRPSERAKPAPRRTVTYWCANAHSTTPSFASGAAVPEQWDCPRCGLPAGLDEHNPPPPPRPEPYKSHLAYVKERRSEAEGAAILAEALSRLHDSRNGRGSA